MNTTQQHASQDGINVIEPSLPKGGGAIKGMAQSFSADDFMGSASLSIPLPVSPCRGYEPQLSLSYNSRGGRSVFGHGFSLSLPSVSRLTSLGIPKYTLDDTFILSGSDYLVAELDDDNKPLVTSVSLGSVNYQVHHFVPRVQAAYSRIQYWINTANEKDQFWQVVSADNHTSIYGKSTEAKVFDPDNPCRIYEWLLEETFDDQGNHIVYGYDKENAVGLSTHELNSHRDHQSKAYLSTVHYGNSQAIIDGSLVTAQSETALNDVDWHFYIAIDYGQYDVSVNQQRIDKVAEGCYWASRPDPYSSYDVGFEIRTLRRCENVLLFHCFEENNGGKPTLREQLKFEYDDNHPAINSLLRSVTQTAYYFNNTTDAAPYYQSQSLPAMTMGHTPFLPLEESYQAAGFEQLVFNDGNGLCPIPDITQYQIIDLYSEGIPGLLYADGQSVFYRQAEKILDQPSDAVKGIQYGPAQKIDFPINRSIHDAMHTLMDVNGNGKLDFVASNPKGAGFYAMSNPDRHDTQWQKFTPFLGYPSDFHAQGIELTDVTGDGLADVVQIQNQFIRINASTGSAGYAPSNLAERLHDVPSAKTSAALEMLSFGNLLGSGNPQRLRIANGTVECWPNLGYGVFGKKVVMENAPDFGNDFTTERLRLADVNGTGLSDLVYLYPERIEIYLNLSGNGFALSPIVISLPSTYHSPSQIQFADIKGNGTACLVFSKIHGIPEQCFFDFNQLPEQGNATDLTPQPQAPYLLQSIENNMGAITTLAYTSSSQFYLDDKQAGNPWVTTQASAINVLACVTKTDLISNHSYTSRYRYHHGYFDGVEREFRGFGCVETINDETFNTIMPAEIGDAWHAPSALTKTWYHTGACLEEQALLEQYQKEYWQGDQKAYAMPDTHYVLATHASGESVRESHRALYGKVLRSEVYGNDGSPWQTLPYSVSQTQLAVKQLKNKGPNKYAVFRVDQYESIAYHYERNADDPKISHSFVLAMDDYGHPIKTVSVVYGRRLDQIPAHTDPQTQQQQRQLGIVYNTVELLNSPEIATATDYYLLAVPQESKAYELTGINPSIGDYFSRSDIQQKVTLALSNASAIGAQAKLHQWQRHYYFDASTQQELALGDIAVPLLPRRSESIAFDITQVRSDFSNLNSGTLVNLLEGDGQHTHDAKGGYIIPSSGDANESNYYWNPGSAQAYHQASGFYLPSKVYSPFHYDSTFYGADTASITATPCNQYSYDPHHLMVIKTVDPLNNSNSVSGIDYQHLHPQYSIDINGNSTSVLLDTLGRVIATSSSGAQLDGKGEKQTTGFADLTGFTSKAIDLSSVTTTAEYYVAIKACITNAASYLSNAATYFYYGDFNWQQYQLPTLNLQLNYTDFTLINGNTVTTEPDIQIQLHYSDGFGRSLQSCAYFDGNTDVSSPNYGKDWLVSGATVYDNKGQPVKQYEPFYADSLQYCNNQSLNQNGVSHTLFYNSLGQKQLVLSPQGFVSKTLTGNLAATKTHSYHGWLNKKLYENATGFQPSPWSSLAYDANDAIADNEYTVPDNNIDITQATMIAINKSCKNTPVQSIVGSYGKVVQSNQLNVNALGKNAHHSFEENAQYNTYSVWGEELTSADARLHPQDLCNYKTQYNLAHADTLIDAADGGKRWQLHDIVGNLIYHKDARGTQVYQSYDVLYRPQQTYVSNSALIGNDKTLNNVVKCNWYGDSVDSSNTPIFSAIENANLRGQSVVSLDEGGLTTVPRFDVTGTPLYHAQWIKEDYKQEAQWSSITTADVKTLATTLAALKAIDHSTTINLPDNVSSLLPNDSYITALETQALGRVTETIDAAGNKQSPTYYSNNSLKTFSITPGAIAQAAAIKAGVSAAQAKAKQTLITDITYNAMGMRTHIQYNNHVATDYTYNPDNHHLMNVVSKRFKSESITAATLQGLAYQHDPVGNIMQCTNTAIPTAYNNNQAVDATATYSYDTLYRLTHATGREQNSASGNLETNQNKFNPNFIKAGDPQALQNYRQSYHYDAGNNLTSIAHKNASNNAATRTNIINSKNNQLVSSSCGGNSKNYCFDANGNMTTLEGTAGVTYNYRDNIASATNIERDGVNSDSEYYVYDGSGQRVRKVSESATKNTTVINEVLYVGGLEVRQQSSIKNKTTTINKIWHAVKLNDDQASFCVWRYWVKGTVKSGNKYTQLRYQLNDFLNSSCLELDDQGKIITYEEYYPYGGTSVSAGKTQTEVKNKHYRYSGKEQDATGLYYYGMRYYAPWLGRWTATDPAGTVDGLNVDGFVGGNPVGYVDVGGMVKRGPQEEAAVLMIQYKARRWMALEEVAKRRDRKKSGQPMASQENKRAASREEALPVLNKFRDGGGTEEDKDGDSNTTREERKKEHTGIPIPNEEGVQREAKKTSAWDDIKPLINSVTTILRGIAGPIAKLGASPTGASAVGGIGSGGMVLVGLVETVKPICNRKKDCLSGALLGAIRLAGGLLGVAVAIWPDCPSAPYMAAASAASTSVLGVVGYVKSEDSIIGAMGSYSVAQCAALTSFCAIAGEQRGIYGAVVGSIGVALSATVLALKALPKIASRIGKWCFKKKED